MSERVSIEVLLSRSSLGTTAAKCLAARTPTEVVEAIIARTREIGHSCLGADHGSEDSDTEEP